MLIGQRVEMLDMISGSLLYIKYYCCNNTSVQLFIRTPFAGLFETSESPTSAVPFAVVEILLQAHPHNDLARSFGNKGSVL